MANNLQPHRYDAYDPCLNERVIVAYEGHVPRKVFDTEITEQRRFPVEDEKRRTYVRAVRRHTALEHDGLTIIDEHSPLYRPAFDELAVGQETIL